MKFYETMTNKNRLKKDERNDLMKCSEKTISETK